MTKIRCIIKKIIFHNPDNGFSVLFVENEDDNVKKNDNSNFSLVVKNGMMNPKIGYLLECDGEWQYSQKYCVDQFVAVNFKEEGPCSTDGLVEYLSSGLFKGIGEATAKKIVAHFGKDTIKILDENPERIKEIKRIGNKICEDFIEQWKNNKEMQDIVTYFSKYGITMSLIMRIHKQYGVDAIKIVEENPYQMIYDIEGIGFKKADDIALKLGFDTTDERRIMSCFEYVLTLSEDSGHTFLYENQLIEAARELLNIHPMLISDGLKKSIDCGEIIEGDNKEIFKKIMYYTEKSVAMKLSELYKDKPFNSKAIDIPIEEIEESIGIKYNERQKEAIRMCLENNIMVLTGGPGTGKTTVLLGIIKALKRKDMTIAAAAPTGRAAKRMTEVTGLGAKTIHRLLEYNPAGGYGKDEESPIMDDVIILDEFSMVNIYLMNSFLKAVRPSTKLILVGDENQLPCIGPGNIIHDIIESEKIPVVTLNEIFRQGEGSKIILNAHNIINEIPISINNSEPDTDFFFIEESNKSKLEVLINDLVSVRLPKKYNVPSNDIQVLSPRRKDVQCSADELNKILQATLNKNVLGIKYGDTNFLMGDKVMQIKNNYEKGVFNGDVGYVRMVDKDNNILYVDFDGVSVSYEKHELIELVLAYASTIHKSQGSEYPIVVIPIHSSFSIMLKRNLIYTGITRAKNICVVVGEKIALGKAIGDNSYRKRNTMLNEYLKQMI